MQTAHCAVKPNMQNSVISIVIILVPGATILLTCGRDRELWQDPIFWACAEYSFRIRSQSVRFARFDGKSQIWREVRESRTSGVGRVGQSQSSRSLPQVRMIVGSGDENDMGWDLSTGWSCAVQEASLFPDHSQLIKSFSWALANFPGRLEEGCFFENCGLSK